MCIGEQHVSAEVPEKTKIRILRSEYFCAIHGCPDSHTQLSTFTGILTTRAHLLTCSVFIQRSGFHVGICSHYNFQGCDTVWSGRSVPTIRRSVNSDLIFQACRLRQHQYPPTKSYGGTTKKTTVCSLCYTYRHSDMQKTCFEKKSTVRNKQAKVQKHKYSMSNTVK